MTQKAKGPAEAATSIPSQVQSPDKGYENMEVDSTAAPIVPDVQSGNIETPWVKYRRLSREIALCLDTMNADIEYVMIRPMSRADDIGHGFIAYGPFNDGEGA